MTPDAPAGLSRRQSLQLAGAGLAGLILPGAIHAQQAAPAPLDPPRRFPRMVHDYYLRKVRTIERRGLELKANLKTKADAEAYVKSVQAKIKRCFAPFPAQKCPLNPQITGVVERDAYRIEKVIFESRPRYFVTANLYIPKGKSGPMPAVVGSCGHAAEGKGGEAYQAFSQGLARMGYVCLIYDPIGQGERGQYFDDHHELIYPGSTHQHNMAGNQQCLVGDFLGSWRAWDGIRALDYLLTRPEVDPKHVGITGNSGGGTMTTWLCGVENRWTMAAPSCFVTTWRRNLENELPQDSEQNPPRGLGLDLDHDDYLAAMAPKPVIILAKEQDFFDVRGSEEAYQRLKRLYALLGAEENIQFFAGPTTHGYSQENREAMYGFFNKVTGVSDAKTEPALTIEDQKTLWCTPEGQVEFLKSRSIHSFTAAKARQLAAKRPKLQGDALRKAVISTLHLPEWKPEQAPDYRILRPGKSRGYPAKAHMTYAVSTEPEMLALVTMLSNDTWYSRPPKPARPRAVLYVADKSADEELRNEPLIQEIIQAEGADVSVFACDVRGIGDSLPLTTGGDPLGYYGPDFFYSSYAIMLNRPYVGGKVYDVLRVLDWLASTGRTEVHLVARGWGAIPAVFAAYLSDRVKQVTLKNHLTSYLDVTQAEHYKWPLSAFTPGVLRQFDLPDLHAALAAKGLRQIAPLNGEMKEAAG